MNCHEAWIHQLHVLGAALDIVVGLPGRYTTTWDERMRPLPPHSRLVTLDDVAAAPAGTWDFLIAHNITDLLDLKDLRVPALLVIHEYLEGRLAQQASALPPGEMRQRVAQYLAIRGAHAIGVSAGKAASWGVRGDPVTFFSDPSDYLPARYDTVAGLRVANHVASKRIFLRWDLHEAAFAGLPVTLIGHNPELGVAAAENWDALKDAFATHRFYVHTADPRYEDGYNMASIEAMAAGLPVIGNRHPTSPITHGVSGFLSNDAAELRGFAERLLADAALAQRMGAAARETVTRHFSPSRFRLGMRAALDAAGRKYSRVARQTA